MSARTYDIFLDAGQSNVEPPNGGGAPTVINGYQFYNSNPATARLNKPNGWAHQFANTYYSGQTTKTPYIIQRSASGVSVTTATATNWSASGTLRGLLETDVDAALAYLSKTDVRGNNWSQGEADALLIDAATITRAQYKTGLQSVVDWITTKYPGIIFNIVRTGTLTTGDTAGFVAVREVQAEIVSENPGVVFMPVTTQTMDTSKYVDDRHYGIALENEIGVLLANSYL